MTIEERLVYNWETSRYSSGSHKSGEIALEPSLIAECRLNTFNELAITAIALG